MTVTAVIVVNDEPFDCFLSTYFACATIVFYGKGLID